MKEYRNIRSVLDEDNLVEEFVKKRSGNPVFLYGIGAGVVWYIKLLERLSIPIAGLCDGFIEEITEMVFDDEDGMKRTYMAYPLTYVYEKYGGGCDYVIAAPRHRKKIIETLERRDHLGIWAFDAVPIVLQERMPREYREYVRRNVEQFENVVDMLEDELSKRIMINCIAGYITSDCDYYEGTSTESQYFPDIVKNTMTAEEVFVDVGAFDGDTIDEFLECVDGKYKKIIAFEPEPKNFEKGKKKYSDPRIEFFKYGCGDQNEISNIIHANGLEGSRLVQQELDEKGSMRVKTIRLDDFIEEKVTYIKMDIEGMELNALRGAEKIIQRDAPKLAISVYHKKEDMVEIINYLRMIQPDYKFYMRHYWDCSGTDIVLFAL